jgi:hypothetical protein
MDRAPLAMRVRATMERGLVVENGTGGQNDPLIKALIQKLPNSSSWPVDDRINWLKMLVIGFRVAYGTEAEIEVKKKEATN